MLNIAFVVVYNNAVYLTLHMVAFLVCVVIEYGTDQRCFKVLLKVEDQSERRTVDCTFNTYILRYNCH